MTAEDKSALATEATNTMKEFASHPELVQLAYFMTKLYDGDRNFGAGELDGSEGLWGPSLEDVQEVHNVLFPEVATSYTPAEMNKISNAVSNQVSDNYLDEIQYGPASMTLADLKSFAKENDIRLSQTNISKGERFSRMALRAQFDNGRYTNSYSPYGMGLGYI
ncbi:MAG: hypothetical protein KTR14_05590 [Vampirovibrio sp.]|nr:hypothetical protein [Vampirovibrio sp.]